MVKEHERAFRPDYAIPPGETIKEILEAGGMTQIELALRLRRSPVNLNEIIQGNKSITPETALRLESVLGVPAYFWINLQSQYDETKARIAREAEIEEEIKLAKRFPYNEMGKLGWVPRVNGWRERVHVLHSYFAVSSLQLVPQLHEAAYRRSLRRKASPEALAAWLRKAEIDALEIVTQPYDESFLRKSIPKLRQLTRKRPEFFEPRIRQICASCGIALVFLPHLKKTYAHGATEWLRSDKALVIITIRYNWADIFWFSFFHEIGHILRHKKSSVFIEYDEKEKSREETDADRFASGILIPHRSLSKLPAHRYPKRGEIISLAKELGVAPGIIVGRLQHEGKIPRSHYNDLRERYRWAKEQIEN